MRTIPAASTLLSGEQIATLQRRTNARGLLLVAHAWGVIGLAMYCCAVFPHWWTYLVAIAIIGSRQLGLLILMHDGAHGILCAAPRLNRFLAQWCCAYPMFADTEVYRPYHLQHHARTQRDDDPDIVLTGHYPISRASLRRKLIRDITGQTGFSQRRAQFRHAWGPRELSLRAHVRRFGTHLGRPLAVNSLLALILSALGQGHFFLFLWLVPLLTWQQLALRVRNIAEHAAVPERRDPMRNARTTLTAWWERIFVAPYWVNYHLEHHLFMWVPCHRLPTVHRYLIANGHLPRMLTATGYRAVLGEVTHLDGDEDGGPRARRAAGTFSDGFRYQKS